MKKFLVFCICLGFSLTAGGCSPGDALNTYSLNEKTESPKASVYKPRVYMDETTGILTDFDGSRLTLKADDTSYIFDVSQATVECKNGLVSGDSVSVIYEGQLSDSDTSAVRALKVVDAFRKAEPLHEETIKGKLQSLTPNTITVQNKDKKNITYPITGTEQYYKKGLKKGSTVHLHFIGNKNSSKHIKVLSVSDTDPLKAPKSAPVPKSPSDEQEEEAEKKLHGVIKNINTNKLQILPDGSETILTVDLSSVPCYFKGGIAPGASLSVTYTGDFQKDTLEGISVLAVTGDNPKSRSHINSTVTGTITGSTVNTLSVETNDGAFVTFDRSQASNSSSGGLLSGSSVKITFDPKAAKDSNIYKCLKIQDA